MMPRDDSDVDADFESVNRMADRLKLKGRDRSRYIDEHMTGLGYRSEPRYVRGGDDDEDGGGGRYRLGGRRRSSSRDDEEW